MSDIKNINSELVEVHGELQSVSMNQGLMKINRLLLTIVFSLMVVVAILGFLLLPADAFVNDYKKVTTVGAYEVEMNPAISAEVNALKGQLVGLVSGSIESKLRTLEKNIRLGAVATSLGTIEDLKNDIKVLRTYSEPPQKDQAQMANEQLIREVGQLKMLIYLTLTSCGLMLAAVAGIWLKNSHLLPHKKVKPVFLRKK